MQMISELNSFMCDPLTAKSTAYLGKLRLKGARRHPRFASNSLIYSTSLFTPSIGMAL